MQSLEKFLKQAVVDRNNQVVSAALISMLTLYKKGGHSQEIVRKLVTDIQDKLFSTQDGHIQYQALIVLFEMKKNDQVSLLKMLF